MGLPAGRYYILWGLVDIKRDLEETVLPDALNSCISRPTPTCSAHMNRCTQFSLNMLEKCPASLCIPGHQGTVRLIQHPAPSRANFRLRLGWSVSVQSRFKYFQGQRFWKYTGQPEPVCKHHDCDLFTLRLEFPSLWLVNIASCPFAVHLQQFWVCLIYKPQKIAEEGNWSPGHPEASSSSIWTNPQPLLAHHVHQPLSVIVICPQTCSSVLVFLLPVLRLGS